MRKSIKTAFLLLAPLMVFAQQNPLVNHGYVNGFLINPANAGATGTNLYLLNRLQWADVEGAPETFMATMDGSIANTNLNYGLSIANDVTNILGKTSIYGTYAYRLPLSDESNLSFGMSFGYEQNKILFDRVNATNPTEITLINNIEQQANMDAKAGLGFSYKNLSLGVSAYQLFANNNVFEDEQRQVAYAYSFERHYAANAQYRITLDEDKLFLDPNVLIRYAPGYDAQADFNLMLNWANRAWIGGGFRTNYGANFMAGGVLGDRLLGSYSYGRSVGPIERLSANSHEFTLGYRFSEVDGVRDEDNDGVPDDMDRQPNTPEGCEVDAYGVAKDDDLDGVYNCLDHELKTPLGAPVDANGVALDDDEDGVINLFDREPNSPKDCPVDKLGVSIDTDMDGVSDCKDMQLKTPLGAEVDENGVALDGDNDGVADLYDLEPNTPHKKHLHTQEDVDASDCIVDAHGVAKDSDKDGITDCVDLEENTPEGALVDAQGRAIDTDKDGVPDGIDREIDSPRGAQVDKWGVAIPDPNDLDDDKDGVPNAIDLEPDTKAGAKVDAYGRTIKEVNPITENRLEIDEMDDNSTEWDYFMIVGVFKNKENVKGYRAKLETKYGEKTRTLYTKAGYHYVYTKQVTTREEAYEEKDRLVNKNVEDYIVGNPWLWREPKK